MDTSKYFDRRSEFFKRYFEQALPYSDYLRTADEKHLLRWQNYSNSLRLSPNQISTLAKFRRKLYCLVLSGTWCGDCARQGAIFNAIESACPLVSFRFAESRANPELQDELRILGGARVPVVVALSEDFFQLGRFGDRTLSIYRRKALTELGAACELGLATPDDAEFSLEADEWIQNFERLELMLRLDPTLRARYQD